MDQQPVSNLQPEVQPQNPLNKTWQIVAIIVAGILVIGGVSYGSYYLWQKSTGNVNQIACTMEAKLCSDGSYVGRTGENCEFAECPATSSLESYYQDLAEKCKEKDSPNCCLSSVRKMASGGYKLAENGTCPAGYKMNGLECIDTYTWCEPEVGDTANWQTYRNEEYGFEINLTDAWKGYRVVKKLQPGSSSVYRLYFEVPTSDKTWMDGYGYASPMAIDIYSISEWQKVGNEISKFVSYPWSVVLNNNYAFRFVPAWQDTPSDLENVDFGIDQILSTFKFTN